MSANFLFRYGIAITIMVVCSYAEAFEASADGVKLEIPVLKLDGWSKATADEQKTISSYWGSGELGTFYPAVIAHERDGSPLFVFALSYDAEISVRGQINNLGEVYQCVLEAYKNPAERKVGQILVKTSFDSEKSGINWKGCFVNTVHRKVGMSTILGKSCLFSGGIILKERVFLVQAFTIRTDNNGKKLFKEALELWLKKVTEANSPSSVKANKYNKMNCSNNMAVSRSASGHNLKIPVPYGYQIASGKYLTMHRLGERIGGMSKEKIFETFVITSNNKGFEFDTLTLGLNDVSDYELDKQMFEQRKEQIIETTINNLQQLKSAPQIISVCHDNNFRGDGYVIITFTTYEYINTATVKVFCVNGYVLLNNHVYQFVGRNYGANNRIRQERIDEIVKWTKKLIIANR